MPLNEMDEMPKPLVSVPVITYNSSKTVLETLDSISNQTYQNIELIVSDDCSTDNTVEICRKWIEAHKERFVRTELLTVEKNTGVSANMNRAERACLGEWVKIIAGDDILLEDCLDSYVKYILHHHNATFVFAKMKPFGGEKWHIDCLENCYLEHQKFFKWTIKQQYDYLTLESNCLPAPTFFYNRLAIYNLGVVNDERIPFLEDWPKWINLLKHEVRFHFLDKVTVLYRIGTDSLSTSSKISEGYKKSLSLFYLYYQFKPQFRAGQKREAVRKFVLSKYIVTNSFFWKGLNFILKRTL